SCRWCRGSRLRCRCRRRSPNPCFTASKRKRRPLAKRRHAAARSQPRWPSKGTGRHMVRFIGFLVGLVFAGVLLISLISGVSSYFANPPAPLAADEFHKEPKALKLASDGPF